MNNLNDCKWQFYREDKRIVLVFDAKTGKARVYRANKSEICLTGLMYYVCKTCKTKKLHLRIDLDSNKLVKLPDEDKHENCCTPMDITKVDMLLRNRLRRSYVPIDCNFELFGKNQEFLLLKDHISRDRYNVYKTENMGYGRRKYQCIDCKSAYVSVTKKTSDDEYFVYRIPASNEHSKSGCSMTLDLAKNFIITALSETASSSVEPSPPSLKRKFPFLEQVHGMILNDADDKLKTRLYKRVRDSYFCSYCFEKNKEVEAIVNDQNVSGSSSKDHLNDCQPSNTVEYDEQLLKNCKYDGGSLVINECTYIKPETSAESKFLCSFCKTGQQVEAELITKIELNKKHLPLCKNKTEKPIPKNQEYLIEEDKLYFGGKEYFDEDGSRTYFFCQDCELMNLKVKAEVIKMARAPKIEYHKH